VFHNQWIVFGGMGIIALSAVLGTLCSANINSNAGSSTVKQQRIEETATPEAAATGTPDPNATPTPSPVPTLRRRGAPIARRPT
jgi:hypothetical protein